MLSLVSNSYQIIGSAHTGLEYLAEALNIAASGKVKPMIEVFPSEDISEAAARATAGDVRFKVAVIY
jgi:alcohol dehydrogenase/propanol-preferring alcohol dehydrogenase